MKRLLLLFFLAIVLIVLHTNFILISFDNGLHIDISPIVDHFLYKD